MQSESRLKNKDVVSVAVQIGKESTLFKLNQALPLQDIIKQLCEDNCIKYIPDHYALQIMDTKENNINKYVTESNRTLYITDGSELRLIFSAKEMCRMVYEKIIREVERPWALEKLCSLCKDLTFAEEFLSTYGITTITELIQKAKPPFDTLHFSVETIFSFFNLNLLPSLDGIPCESLANFVVSVNSVPEIVTEASLCLLKEIIKSKKTPDSLSSYIRNRVTLDDVIALLWNKDNPNLQEKALSFVNALSSEASGYPAIMKEEAMKVREVLWKNIILNSTVMQNSTVLPSMAHELYIYQCIVLKFLSSRLNTSIEPNSDEALSLQELNNISYSYEQHIQRDSIVSLLDETAAEKLSLDASSARSSAYECDASAEKLRTPTTPRSPSAIDLDNEHNDGVISYHRSNSLSLEISQLTLDCMLYFDRKKRKTYNKIMLMEEKVQRKPFYAICDRLVHLLCDVLQVGQKPSDTSTCYQPLLFEASEESPFFEELFSHVAIRLTSTRKEMKARTSQDHEQVLKVLRHQVMTVLKLQLPSWKKFDEALKNETYENVVASWQLENDQNLMKLQDLPAVMALRDSLRPQMEEIISRHRLNLLCQGAKFIKVNARTQKQKKFWFISLSPNHTVFHYGDCGERDSDIECLSKMSVSNIKELVVGKKCPHVKEAKNNRKTEPEFAFSLMLDQAEPASLDFIAPTQEVYDYWTDGLGYLLVNKMKSKSMEAELKNLLDMEVRLHLLELEGIDIPHATPSIPKPPSNYDFSKT